MMNDNLIANSNLEMHEVFCQDCCIKLDMKFNSIKAQSWDCGPRRISNPKAHCYRCGNLLNLYHAGDFLPGDFLPNMLGVYIAAHCVKIHVLIELGLFEDKPKIEDLSR